MTVINVIVAKKKTISVTSGSANLVSAAAPVTLRNIPTMAVGITKLAQLNDVDATTVVEGDTLVYHANTAKYTVEPLDINNTIGTLDGGSF